MTDNNKKIKEMAASWVKQHLDFAEQDKLLRSCAEFAFAAGYMAARQTAARELINTIDRI